MNRKVLVVEDNADLLETLVFLLEMMGHTVLAAPDGRRALELARQERPDTALIDIGLPDIDGYELARRLRNSEQVGSMRLVALTGYSEEEYRDRALAAGFDLHLVKPADLDALERILGS